MVGTMLIAEAGKIVLSGRVLCSRLEAKSVTPCEYLSGSY
jgi:hypothetical protein